jgi:hypothetical protein
MAPSMMEGAIPISSVACSGFQPVEVSGFILWGHQFQFMVAPISFIGHKFQLMGINHNFSL